MKLKFNAKSISGVSKNANFTLVVRSVIFALVMWLLITILETILISGGLYVKGAPFTIFELILVAVAMFIYSKRMILGKKELIISLITIVVSYAILDFLLINLLLQRNDLSVYKFWAYYLKYVVIALPVLTGSKATKITIPNLKLPLTKKK